MTAANLSVDDTEAVIQYTSTGETAFTFPFPILEADELRVSIDQVDQVNGTDYTVSGVGDEGGGTVTFTAATTAGEIVTIWLEMDIERLTGFSAGASTILPKSLNDELARSVRVEQMLRRDIQRALRLPVDDNVSGANMELPVATSRASKFLKFSSTGIPELVDEVSLSGVALSKEAIAEYLWPRTDDETSSSVTPSAFAPREIYHAARYGAVGDGSADDSQALTDLFAAAPAGSAIYLQPGATYKLTSSPTISANRLRVYGNGATLKYDATNTDDQVLTFDGDDCVIEELIADANKSALSGTNGDGHTGSGYGIKITGDRNVWRACQANNTPVTTTSTSSAGFETRGIDNVFERCSASGVEYNGWRCQMDQNAQVNGNPVGAFVLRDCRAEGHRGFTNNSNARLILLDNFDWSPATDSSSAWVCETNVGVLVQQFVVMNTTILQDSDQQIGKSVQAQVAIYRNCVLKNLNDADEPTDCIRIQGDWQDPGDTATRVSDTEFSVPTDRTDVFTVGRGVRIEGDTTARGTITASAFSSVTTVTVDWDGSDVTPTNPTDVDVTRASQRPKLLLVDGCFLECRAQGTGSTRAPLTIETDSAEHVIVRDTLLNIPDGDYLVHCGTEFAGRLDLINCGFTGAPALALVRTSSAASVFPRVNIIGGYVDITTSVQAIAISGSTPTANRFSMRDLENRGGLAGLVSSTGIPLPAFAAADATPSVLGHDAWQTDSGTLTITDFDDGYTGQVITVISKGAVTFDTTGTSLVGSSVDIVTASGDVTQWMLDGANWRLLGYVDASVDNSGGA